MSIAKRPSKITLPSDNKGWGNLLDFLVEKFPLIEKEVWQKRFKEQKIHWQSNNEAVTEDTAYIPSKVLCYYREVEEEPSIPFKHQVIFQNENFLIACKPHFLPVTPGGKYVNECLLERIRQEQQLPDIVPLHRLDRETAGLVMFSVNPENRGIYAQLFAQQKITKEYRAVAEITPQIHTTQEWHIKNRLIKSEPKFLMQEAEGTINAHSKITLLEKSDNLGLFELRPLTGKTHQLRLHMMKIGYPILYDKFYPNLLPKQPLDFQKPLQLLAKKLAFTDPFSGKNYQFESNRQLIY